MLLADRPVDKYNPKYYRVNKLESIEIIEAFNLPFGIGNALKYLIRCNKECPKEDINSDINKAIWYLSRELEVRKLSKSSTALNISDVIIKEKYFSSIYEAINYIFLYIHTLDEHYLKKAIDILLKYK